VCVVGGEARGGGGVREVEGKASAAVRALAG